MTSFKIEMDVRIDDDEAHLMTFVPEKLNRAFDNTKVHIDRICVTKEEEKNT
jgi:hypothetical protein